MTFTDDDLDTLKRALTDASDYRRDGGEECVDCEDLDDDERLCEDHQGDQDLADEYDALLDRINQEDTP